MIQFDTKENRIIALKLVVFRVFECFTILSSDVDEDKIILVCSLPDDSHNSVTLLLNRKKLINEIGTSLIIKGEYTYKVVEDDVTSVKLDKALSREEQPLHFKPRDSIKIFNRPLSRIHTYGIETVLPELFVWGK
jgi:hypothetical protein